jgi:hypothetical protein
VCSTVCAVNRGDAVGLDTWWSLPMEEKMTFRIQISISCVTSLVSVHVVLITVSEYLRLHGRTPEIESTDGVWLRLYHTRPNIFRPDVFTPSLFVIENHWYDPQGTTRVDYIPEMRTRANLTHEEGPTEISKKKKSGMKRANRASLLTGNPQKTL